MDRRAFLRNACQACAALAIAPAAAAALEGCASASKAFAVNDGFIDVPLEVLRNGNRAVVKASGVSNKLFIARDADGGYTAVELNCPHKNGPVKEKDGHLVCEWHGSTFSRDGKVTKGPSRSDLKRFPVQVEGTSLRVYRWADQPSPSTYRRSFAKRGILLCASFMPRAFIQAANAPRGKERTTNGRSTLPVIRSL